MLRGLGKMLGVTSDAAGAANGGTDFPEPDMRRPMPFGTLTPFPLTGDPIPNKGYLYITPSVNDFAAFRQMCDAVDGWTLRYNCDGVYAWDRSMPGAPMRLIKVFGVFEKTEPGLIYDILQDADFRQVWDANRLDAAKLARLTPNADISYYAAKAQPPVVNRDFVTLRSWRNCGGDEFIIMSTSVPHVDMPPRKGFVRAATRISGYVIRPWGDGGSALTYMTQADPKGWLPGAFVNTLTVKLAPNVVANMRKAVLLYPDFVAEHGADRRQAWATPAEAWPYPMPSPLCDWILACQASEAPPPPVVPVAEAPPEGEEELPEEVMASI